MRKGRKTQIIAGIFALQFVLQTAFINTGVTAFADEADAQIPAMTESAETVEETAPAAAPAELAGDTAPADDQTFVPFDAFNDAIMMSGTFQSGADYLRAYVEDVCIRVEYKNADGEVVSSREFR